MHNYYRNHQLYLAERMMWMDKHVTKISVRSLLKIQAYKTSTDEDDKKMCKILVEDSLLQYIGNVTILSMEGYYYMNLKN